MSQASPDAQNPDPTEAEDSPPPGAGTKAGSEADRPSGPAAALGSRIRAFPLTFGLIGVTLLVFLGQLLSQISIGYDLVLALGAKVNEFIAAGELWRLVTPILIHGGLGHFFINMYSLFAIGPTVERAFGPRRMFALYWLSGICGVLFSLAFSPHPSVGASGAIFGLLGALGAFLYANRVTFGTPGRFQLRQIVLVALLNLALGLSPGIDAWGHLGGLIFGAGLSWFISPLYAVDWSQPNRRRLVDQRPWERVWPVVLAGAGLLALLALAALS